MTTVRETFGMAFPKPFKYKEEEATTNQNQLMGVEVETERCVHSYDTYNILFKGLGVETKEDGSLRRIGNLRAWEFITKPTRLANLMPIMKAFYAAGAFTEENYSDRCSIHVHANCTDMTWEQVSNVALIYTVVEEILFAFVNERPGQRDGWSRDTNIYCVPWNQCRNHLNLVNNFIQAPAVPLARWQKYTALNLAPLSTYGTVEFRHMHGTADMVKVGKWLNIIGAIMKCAKESTLAQLSEDVASLNTSSHYEAFFMKVTGGQIPFNQMFRMKMEEGAILAKYSMSSWHGKPATAASTAQVAVPRAPDPIAMDNELFATMELMAQQEADRVRALDAPIGAWAQQAPREQVPTMVPRREVDRQAIAAFRARNNLQANTIVRTANGFEAFINQEEEDN